MAANQATIRYNSNKYPRKVREMKFKAVLFLIIGAVCTSFGSTWIEGSGNIGDAPSTSPGQNTIGDSGALTTIQGRFRYDDVDVYRIQVVNPAAFSATTVGLAGNLDTQLFLFFENGRGVTHNDDDPGTNSIQSTITGQFVPAPGIYYLAVTQYNRDPKSAADRFLWNNAPFNTERQPDGPGAAEAWTNWSLEPLLDGDYEISLTGADFAEFGQTPPPPQENIWVESIDAGQLLPGQMTIGEGLLVRIDGTLVGLNDADLFCIQIYNPAEFRASTIGQIAFDSQLFLFNDQGFGVTSNDDDPGISGSWSIITGQFVTQPGTYYLAISRKGQDPKGPSGEIWLDEPTASERQPDGPAAAEAITSWSNQGVGRGGPYSIVLSGAKFCTQGLTLIPPNSYELIRGTPISGGLSELTFSDNVYNVVGPGITISSSQDPFEAKFSANLTVSNPAELRLLVESRGSSQSLRQIVEVFDWVASQWIIVDSQQLPAGGRPDLPLNIDILPIPNVISPSRKVSVRIRVKANGPVLSFPWRWSGDQVGWLIRSQ